MSDIFESVGRFFAWIFAIFICVMAIFWTIMLFGWIIAGFEYQTWNRLHGTNYTQYEWFTGSDFIQKYHYPDRDKTEKKEINVNLNQ